jgi:hypothetical protein
MGESYLHSSAKLCCTACCEQWIQSTRAENQAKMRAFIQLQMQKRRSIQKELLRRPVVWQLEGKSASFMHIGALLSPSKKRPPPSRRDGVLPMILTATQPLQATEEKSGAPKLGPV